MRERLSIQKLISFTPSNAEKIQKAANTFNVSFAEIIRECVDKELSRLIDRENKRKQARKKQ